jgi:TetR/AcrR family transcriptional regulator
MEPAGADAADSALAEADVAARERLLASAAELFATQGFAATAVREICAAAHVTKPVLYYYFGSKNGLAQTLFREAAGDLAERVREIAVGPGPVRERLKAMARLIFDRSSAAPKTCRFFFASLFAPREAAPWFDYDTMIPAIIAHTEAVFAEGVRTGETPAADPPLAAMMLLGAVQAYAMRFVRRGDVALTAELADRIVDGLLGAGHVQKGGRT